MIIYKVDILAELKKSGYSTYRIRKENIFGQETLTKIKNNQVVYGNTLDKLCELLHCQPGDLLEYRNANQSDSNQSAGADAETEPSER